MDGAQFVSFQSDIDLNEVPVAARFQASWQIRNSGDTVWDERFKLVHIHENAGSRQLTAKPAYALSLIASDLPVEPGMSVHLTLTLQAPLAPDQLVFTDWQLQNETGVLFGDILWLRLVTVERGPGGGAFRRSDSQYLADVTIPDGSQLVAETPFLKQWLVRNSGERRWNRGYRLVWVGGDRLSGNVTQAVPEAAPGAEIVLAINQIAPAPRDQPFVSTWRLFDDRNIPFGDQFWTKIESVSRPDGSGSQVFSQNDPRWRDSPLGWGTHTFGEYGCLVTDMSMMLGRFGIDLDPQQLNELFLRLPAGQGFQGSDVYFAAPAHAFAPVRYQGNFRPYLEPVFAHSQHDARLISHIDEALHLGHGVILQVDSDPTSPYDSGAEQHWVFAVAREGSDYLVVDPSDGRAVSLLSRYGRQSRPQPPAVALKEAIISALIYDSSTAADREMNDADVRQGHSQIGG